MGMAAAESQFHVLAVDDSLIDRKLIERLLKTSSYQAIFFVGIVAFAHDGIMQGTSEVTTVDSGSKALEFLGWHENDRNTPNGTNVSPKIHQDVEVNLVITDYCMPGMTGYDLLKKIKESSSLKNIPVVIMSSENVPSRISRCLEEGAEEFFLKPVRLSDVNKLKSLMMRTKCSKNVQNQEDLAKQENKESPEIQLQTANNNNNNNNKRKAMDEGISPDRTRPRYNDITLVSN